MKKVVLIVTLLLLGLFYINTQTHWITNRTYKVKDVSKKEKIVLHKMKVQEHVHAFFVQIRGHINGIAKIKFYNSLGKGVLYRYKTISGDVNIRWEGDWYTDIIEIEYEPIDVKEGELSLEYSFDGV